MARYCWAIAVILKDRQRQVAFDALREAIYKLRGSESTFRAEDRYKEITHSRQLEIFDTETRAIFKDQALCVLP